MDGHDHGARRGELCAVRREDLDLTTQVVSVRTGLKLIDKQWVRLDTKTHQQRRIAIDDDTTAVLREHIARIDAVAELIAAGVDVRTVAGRLGHGGGGTTTLKVYAAWVSEVDQRAAAALAKRLPRPAAR